MSDNIKKVLVANRGIIAKRVMRTCKELGLKTIGIYSDDDYNPSCFTYADQIFEVKCVNGKSGYLNEESILKIAKENNAAIHPGYGFLSENYLFAKKCSDENIKFIAPSPEVIKFSGNKILCKQVLSEHNIPVIESISCNRYSSEIRQQIIDLGLPVLIKPAFGGGGIGMVVIDNAEEIENSLNTVFELSNNFFDSTELLIEKYLPDAKHIEVQLLGDKYGNVTHLFERECSMQRRKQKVIEESPSVLLNDLQRDELYTLAVKIGEIIKLDNVATIEFILANDRFYFLEINPRIQVEHAVTEELTGVDLVEQQIRLADGMTFSFQQKKSENHVIEVRVYAEDPYSTLPAPGTINYFYIPDGNNLRIESCVENEMRISETYDPLLMKVITSGENRELARKRMINSLRELDINSCDTLRTNIMSLILALEKKEFKSGIYNTVTFENMDIVINENELFELLSETFLEKKSNKLINTQGNNNSFWKPSFWQVR